MKRHSDVYVGWCVLTQVGTLNFASFSGQSRSNSIAQFVEDGKQYSGLPLTWKKWYRLGCRCVPVRITIQREAP